jgi:regulator of protease activity HflC (stomatin/prohibitin superfamily)
MNKRKLSALAIAAALSLTACGTRVEVPPAHTGKIMTKDGYQEGTISSSVYRLPACLVYCDKMVLLDTSDKAKTENMTIFMPEDKLNLKVGLRVTLSINPKETNSLFTTLPQQAAPEGTPNADVIRYIGWDQIYNTYAQQVILTEAREYLSKYSISAISSSMEKVNSDLRVILQKKIEDRTPFSVRYVGITNVEYPSIITQAQENAAERREAIAQEEAQLNVSRVRLERQLEETRLQRQIDVEKAEADAEADRVRAQAANNPAVITLRKLEIDMVRAQKWNGQLPATVLGEDTQVLLSK